MKEELIEFQGEGYLHLINFNSNMNATITEEDKLESYSAQELIDGK